MDAVLSRRAPRDLAIGLRVYTIAPLSFLHRAQMKSDLAALVGQGVTTSQLYASRRRSLQELAPDNLAQLLAVLDEAEAVSGTMPAELADQVRVIDAALVDVPAHADLVRRNMLTVQVIPLVAARYGLRAWSGPGLPAFRRVRNVVPDELLDQVPFDELEQVGWEVWNGAHLSEDAEKNSAALSQSNGSQPPTPEA